MIESLLSIHLSYPSYERSHGILTPRIMNSRLKLLFRTLGGQAMWKHVKTPNKNPEQHSWENGYGSMPIDTFLVGWTSIYQLFWGSLGTSVLTHPQMTLKFFVCAYRTKDVVDVVDSQMTPMTPELLFYLKQTNTIYVYIIYMYYICIYINYCALPRSLSASTSSEGQSCIGYMHIT